MYPPTIARTRPDAPAYVMAESGQTLTYGDLDARSNALAHLLREHGVGQGATLVLLLPNDLSWPVAVAAGMRSGLLVTPVNWHLGAEELSPILLEAAPDAVLTSTALLPRVQQALHGTDVRPLLLITDRPQSDPGRPGDPGDGPELAFWPALLDQPTTPIADESLGARVLFSGGTTGRPRAYRQPLLGVHPTQAPARHPWLAGALDFGSDMRLLSPAPNYHAAPFTFHLMVLAAGGTVVCMERFDAAAACAALDRHRITHSQWVPTMLSRLLALPPDERPPAAPSHRVAVTSGGPCAPELKEAIDRWWGGILHEYYGASEGYGHTYLGPDESRIHRGSVGRPLGEARVRVVDEREQDLSVGTVGRVVFEQRRPDGTSALKGMGDMGYLDADGYLYLAGRQSFMIVSGGVNVYPEEIETVLAAHPAVADVAVFGVPHPDLGEQVMAVVQPGPGADEDAAGRVALERALDEYCRGRLAGYKTPRSWALVDELPRLPTGKLNKRALQRAWSDPTDLRGTRSSS